VWIQRRQPNILFSAGPHHPTICSHSKWQSLRLLTGKVVAIPADLLSEKRAGNILPDLPSCAATINDRCRRFPSVQQLANGQWIQIVQLKHAYRNTLDNGKISLSVECERSAE
jgi:hypothetical protein